MPKYEHPLQNIIDELSRLLRMSLMNAKYPTHFVDQFAKCWQMLTEQLIGQCFSGDKYRWQIFTTIYCAKSSVITWCVDHFTENTINIVCWTSYDRWGTPTGCSSPVVWESYTRLHSNTPHRTFPQATTFFRQDLEFIWIAWIPAGVPHLQDETLL